MSVSVESSGPVSPAVAKPASQSRTIRFNNFMMWLAAVIGIVPDLLSWILNTLGDPNIASAVGGAIPAKYRVAFGVVTAIAAARNKNLRYSTTQPIYKDSAGPQNSTPITTT